jgi:hypothetical protein
VQEDEAGPDTCDDGLDNGEDGLTDAADPDCILGYENASFCTYCHSAEHLGITHQEAKTNPSGLMDVEGLPINRDWNGDIGDFEGTRLYDATGHTVEDTGPGYIFCKTCHTPHAAWDDESEWEALNTMDVAVPGFTVAPICDNCHP